jgi:hypothetical protein
VPAQFVTPWKKGKYRSFEKEWAALCDGEIRFGVALSPVSRERLSSSLRA